MREILMEQLGYVQNRINEITMYYNRIDIKQISDLQRYFEMQRNIIESLKMSEGL
ncbi:hypothetical protein [Peribacillus asahii]|uniref:hypothetical protein n=1 Tax=Peribacillus asahii TaxID=228899 RepID=UPI0038246293